MKKLILSAVICLSFTACMNQGNLSTDERFVAGWEYGEADERVEISRILFASGANCPGYYIRRNNEGGNSFLIACTPDSIHWAYYEVLADSQKIIYVSDSLAAPEIK